MKSLLNCVLAVAVVSSVVLPVAHAQAPIEDTPIPMWVPDGPVGDVVKVGNTLVVGGQFDYIGPPTGPFAVVDTSDATAFNTAAGLLGYVGDVVTDGSGGWIVATTPVPNTTGLLARIAADGTRDPGFAPPAGFLPWAMTTDGGHLFAFGSANTGMRFVKLDATTGALVPWTPAVLQASVGRIIVSGGVVYASSGLSVGNFRSSAMAFDASTGAVVVFPALQEADVAAAVGNRTYVVSRTVTAHTLSAYVNGQSDALFASAAFTLISGVVASPTHVYVLSGSATGLGQIVALDAASGATVWTSPMANGVADMALEGNTLFVGGSFTFVGGAARSHLAAFDATTGALLTWAPSVSGPVGVATVAAAAGRVAFGGWIRSVGGIARRGLVSLDLTTGRPTPVQPPSSGYVTALATTGDLVVVGTGSLLFQEPPEVYAYSAATGTPFPRRLAVHGPISSMAIHGSTLLMGGLFEAVDGKPRRNLAAYDLAAGQLLPWNPRPDGAVRRVKLHAGALYAVGLFDSLTGYGRNGAVSFDLDTLDVTSWNPQHGGTHVNDVDAWQDRIFLGVHVRDELQQLPPFSVVKTLAVDRFSGAALNIDLPIGTDVAQVGGTLAVTGDGRRLNASMAPFLTFDGTTGQPLPWNPAIVNGGSLDTGGTLLGLDGYLVVTEPVSVGGRPISGLAVFKPRIVLPGAPRQIQMTVTGSTVSLGWLPGASPAPLAYVLEAGSAPGLADLGRFPVGTATQVAAGVPSGSYALRVRAIGASGEGRASSEWLFTTPAGATPPSAPSGLVGTVTGNIVTLGWTAAAGNATTYVIEGGTAPGVSNLGVLPTGSLDTAIAGAVPAGTYHFRMRAANAFGSSAPSNEIVLVVP